MTVTPPTSQAHTPETFTDYKKVVITLVNDLKRLRDFSKKLGLENAIPLIEDVLDRVHNNTFSVAVVGEFKRGKSTFINALLGQEILPADILPCSATLNRVTYGVKPGVKIVFWDDRQEDVDIDQLADYVTKLTPESEERAANIKEAVVYYPVHYCQNNVDIIDTPGLNDEANMTKVTLSVLPKVDAAIMVILAQSPFAETEREFLETKLLTTDLGRIIFVVTGIDHFNRPEDADRGINYIKDRINSMVLKRAREQYGEDSPEYEVYRKKIGKPKVFGVSGYQALEAKRTGDNPELLTQSRFPEFEAALEKFLTQERGATFLQVPINRIIGSASEILKTISLRENALAMQQDEFRAAYDQSVAEIQSLRDRNAEEMQLIDQASKKVKQRVEPLIWQLETELKQAATEVITAAEIKPGDLKNKKLLTERLGRKVSDAVQKAAKRHSEKIQGEIDQGLLQEVSRLQEFASSVELVLQRVEMQFLSVDAETRAKVSAEGEGLGTALAMSTPILGGAWLGYREAGFKGAAVGAAGSLGATLAAALVVVSIGIPVTFPVAVVVGIISMFSGGWLTKKVFGGEQVENFKANFIEGAGHEIEKQLRENRIDQKVYAQITEIFDSLKHKVRQEVDSLLDDTQNTLSDLRAKRARDELVTEHQQQELTRMKTETQQILGNAERLSKQLIQQVNL
jgi:predicted GTPase